MRVRFSIIIILLLTFPLMAGSEGGKKPKNIIIIIGDGMGMNQVTSEVIYNHKTPFKRFENIGMSVTSAADALITDSAAGATAIATGEKSYNGAIAVDTLKQPLETIFELAVKKGKKAGLVTTSPITDATPACFFAHVDTRKKHTEIAEQLVNAPLHVVIGGGRKYFLPQGNDNGVRTDGVNLIDKIKSAGFFYSSDYPVGGYKQNSKLWLLLDSNAVKKAGERSYTLNQLAQTALNQLKNEKNGFVLMVESAQIDYAGHSNDAVHLKNEMKEFAELLHSMLDFIEKDKNTLLVVTADHETGGMSIVHSDEKAKPEMMKFTTKGHSASIVGVFAKGPGSEAFRGLYENNEIGLKLFSIVKSWK